MSLFSKNRGPAEAPEATIVFEVDRGYDQRLIGKSRSIAVFIDGEHAVTLCPGESQEVRTTQGRHKFTISGKDGKKHITRSIDGNAHCFLYEDDGDTEARWGSGGGVLSAVNGDKKASAETVREVTLFFRAEAGLTGRDRKVDIRIDGTHVATLGTGERYQHRVETGTHTFQFNDEISRQVIQQDTGCFIALERRIQFEFFDPRSLLGKNRLRSGQDQGRNRADACPNRHSPVRRP